MKVNEILKELKKYIDKNYKNFNEKNIPTKQKILGVRLPILKKTARKISLNNPFEFIKADKNNIYELIMLEGLTLSYTKTSFINLLPYIENFLIKVDNWAQTDYVINNFKSISETRKQHLKIILKWLNKNGIFFKRAALVSLIYYYTDKNYLKIIFDISLSIKSEDYYVYTANAWLLTECLTKYPLKTIEFLKDSGLDEKTYKKTMQKIRESKKIHEKYKKILFSNN